MYSYPQKSRIKQKNVYFTELRPSLTWIDDLPPSDLQVLLDDGVVPQEQAVPEHYELLLLLLLLSRGLSHCMEYAVGLAIRKAHPFFIWRKICASQLRPDQLQEAGPRYTFICAYEQQVNKEFTLNDV